MAALDPSLTPLLSLLGCSGLARIAVRRLAADARAAGENWNAIWLRVQAAGARAPTAGWLHAEASRFDRAGVTLIALGDAGYPAALSAIPDAPVALVALGRGDVLQVPGVAVVGARRCSAAGEAAAYALGRDLARAGLCVVSGLARGIDGAAHRGALDAGGATVAVLGAGHDHVYPREHRALALRIAATGAVVSEYPPGTAPRKHQFPERNRIISGLARAVVLIEAGEKSGSLITARLALEQGRDVLAVPGAPETGRSRGCHRLIRAGAALVESSADVLAELGIEARTADSNDPESPLLRCLSEFEATSIDALVSRSGWPIERLLEALIELELAGFVTPLDGGYIRAPR